MRFKRENWQPTIGDKYALVNFGGMTFTWLKHQSDDDNNIHFEEVTPIAVSSLQLGKERLLANVYAGIQVSSKYMRERHHEFVVKKLKQSSKG